MGTVASVAWWESVPHRLSLPRSPGTHTQSHGHPYVQTKPSDTASMHTGELPLHILPPDMTLHIHCPCPSAPPGILHSSYTFIQSALLHLLLLFPQVPPKPVYPKMCVPSLPPASKHSHILLQTDPTTTLLSWAYVVLGAPNHHDSWELETLGRATGLSTEHWWQHQPVAAGVHSRGR